MRWVIKPIVWLAGLGPFLWLATGYPDRWGVNPLEYITLFTGKTALIVLMVTLAVTPVRRLTGWNDAIRLRRLIGIFAFFYVVLHLCIYLGLDRVFRFGTIVEDIAKRPFITVGFAAFLILLALTITSTKGWIRRLGKRWQKLHRLVYLAGGLAVLHYYWKVKADTSEPLIFAGIFALLMLFRLPVFKRLHSRGASSRPVPATAEEA
jgi:sulfoxide reductase heme-binding subunit YedZ